MLFNFFKPKPNDEPLQAQSADLLRFPEQFSIPCLEGENCDEITGAIGEFGRIPTNPIPVNGPLGEIKYLSRLHIKNGPGVIFHRLGSVNVPQLNLPVDVFETVSLDGEVWDILYISMYHPRRSTKIPKSYVFSKFDKLLSLLPMGFGTLKCDPNFPFTIDQFIERDLDIFGTGITNKRLAERYREFIVDKDKFKRPTDHQWKIVAVSASLNKTAYYQLTP